MPLLVDFESSSLPSNANVDFSQIYKGFTRISGSSYAGSYCLKSNTITHSQTTHSYIKFTTATAGTLSLYAKVSSENGYDFLTAHITTTATQPTYSSTAGRFVYMAGTAGYTQYSYSCSANTTYYLHLQYRKDGSSSIGSDCGWFDNISIPVPITVPPTISTTSATLITSSTATVGVNITDTGGEDPLLFIEYGTTDSYGTTVELGASGKGESTIVLDSLLPNTTYYCRAYATNSAGTVYGDSLSFTTMVGKPSVSNVRVTNKTKHEFTISYDLTDDGNDSCSVSIYYGLTDLCNDGVISKENQSCGESSVTIENLCCSKAYFYRIDAENSEEQYSTETFSEKTSVCSPFIATLPASATTYCSAVLCGEIIDSYDEEHMSCFLYGNTPSCDTIISLGTTSRTRKYIHQLFDLSPNTTYYYKFSSSNLGGESIGEVQSFKTNRVMNPNIPSVPTMTTIDKNHVQLSSSDNSHIVCDGKRNKSGSIWKLQSGCSYGAQAYYPESSEYLHSDYSDTLRFSCVEPPSVLLLCAHSGANHIFADVELRNCEKVEYGICIGESPNPTILDEKIIADESKMTNSNRVSTTHLNAYETGSMIYVRAYAIVNDDALYSEQELIEITDVAMRLQDGVLYIANGLLEDESVQLASDGTIIVNCAKEDNLFMSLSQDGVSVKEIVEQLS